MKVVEVKPRAKAVGGCGWLWVAVGGCGWLSPAQLMVFEHWDELSLSPVILHVISWILEYLECDLEHNFVANPSLAF